MTSIARAGRIALIVGVLGALAFVGRSSVASHDVVFDECGPSPTVTPTQTPESSPADTPPPNPEPTQAPENCVPKSGDRIWGTRTLRFQIQPDKTRDTRTVSLWVLADERSVPDGNGGAPLYEDTFKCFPGSGNAPTDFIVGWDSIGDTPRNGKYRVLAKATTYGIGCTDENHSATAERKNLLVDNPPDAVGAPRVIATTQTTIAIQWDASKVPDVQTYTVYRAVTKDNKTKPLYSALKAVAFVPGNSFRDQQVSPGVYWYSVRVTRRSVVTPDTGISSVQSPISSAIEIKAPPPPPVSHDGSPQVRRFIPLNRLALPPVVTGLPAVPDAPYSAQLPYDVPKGGKTSVEAGGTSSAEPGNDPRGPVLPVAVGAFLVSAALALGRMPY